MTLWLSLCVLLSVAMVFLARSFLRRFSEQGNVPAKDLALYKEQIRELEIEFEKGALTKLEVEETRREIERRVLKAHKQPGDEDMKSSEDTVRLIGIALTLGWVSIGSVFLYKVVGRPELASAPSTASSQPDSASLQALATPSLATQPAAQDVVADVNTMIARLAARLEDNPDDIRGWRMLAWSYQRTNNLEGAIGAYARAAELAPEDDELLSLYGEALTRANGGVVDVRAQELFARSLRLNPANPRAGFFEGLALQQSGQSEAAINKWLEILDRSPPDGDWVPGLKERIREVASEMGYDLGKNSSLLDSPESQPRSLLQPTENDIRAASEMTGENREAMILSMVNGLAERLEKSPYDPEGWSRLIRSYVVLDNRPKAMLVLAKAREIFEQDANALAQINTTASSLSLN